MSLLIAGRIFVTIFTINRATADSGAALDVLLNGGGLESSRFCFDALVVWLARRGFGGVATARSSR